MTTKRLEVLEYQILIPPTLKLVTPQPKSWLTRDFKASLDAAGHLTVKLLGEYDSEHSAREAIEPYLGMWLSIVPATPKVPRMTFIYETARWTDGSRQTFKDVGARVGVAVAVADFPDPPGNVEVTPDVRSLLHRWQGYLEGREPLAAMAYFVLTLIEDMAARATAPTPLQRRDLAARHFAITGLGDVGRLSTNLGDYATARKAPRTAPRPFSDAQVIWLEMAVQRIITRTAEVASLGMSSPPLPLLELGPPPE